VLVNNVGTTGHTPAYFLNIPNLSSVITNITRINITSIVKVRLVAALCCLPDSWQNFIHFDFKKKKYRVMEQKSAEN